MGWDSKRRLREIAEKETGASRKDPGGKINVCLAYPNSYYLGMSNLGFTSIYSFLNSYTDVCCERAFLPEGPDDMGDSISVWTVESQRVLADFDLLGFSISFENDYINILKILKAAHIPPLRDERGPGYPLLFCGGFAPTLNPETVAEIFDFIVLGDGEGPVEGTLDLLRQGMGSKEEFIRKLPSVQGVYTPSSSSPMYDSTGGLIGIDGLHEGVVPSSSDINVYPAFTTVLTPDTEFGDMFLIEIARGCGKHCFFCGVSHRPGKFRFVELDRVKELIKEGLRRRKRIGLVGSAVLDHPHFKEIGKCVLEEGGMISPASVRADKVDEEVAAILGASRLRSAALAPETGDEEVRLKIGKGIEDERFFRAALLLYDKGIKNIKLYFIAGLPGASEESDVAKTVDFVKSLFHYLHHQKRGRGGPKIIVSIGGFVPKALTPYQFAPFPGVERLKSTYKRVKNEMRDVKGTVKIEHDVPKYTYLQALLSRGDRRVSRILGRMNLREDPVRTFRSSPLNPDYFLRERREEEFLPWDGVYPHYRKESLWERYLSIRNR